MSEAARPRSALFRGDEDAPLQQWQTAEEFAQRLGQRRRKAGAPVRNQFVADDREGVKPPMAQLLSATPTGGGGRGGQLRLKLYLSLLWAASAAPYQVTRPARAWAALLGLPDPKGRGARRIQSTLRELADRGLISLKSQDGMPGVVILLSELGTHEPYEPPSETHNRLRTMGSPPEKLAPHQYFRLPSTLWTSGLICRLSGPGLAMLLVLRCEQRSKDGSAVWFSPQRATNRFGLSESTRRAGLEELRQEGLVVTTSQMLTESGSSLDVYRRRKVHTLTLGRANLSPKTLGKIASPALGGSVSPVAEVVSIYERTLADRERALGPDHPETLESRSNLSTAYLNAGRLADAVSSLDRTLADRERVLGPDHPDTLISRNKLAQVLWSTGRHAESALLFERTLADRERVLGPDHPNTLMSRNNLARVYRAMGRSTEGLMLLERTLADRERVLGPDHPDTLTSRNDLATAYQSAGRLDEATPLLEKAAHEHESILGPDHPGTLIARNNLATAYHLAGRLDEALSLHERTLADRERVLGPDHPDTLVSRNNLASAYEAADRLPEAMSLLERTLADRERVLGPDHPDTLESLSNLASAYKSAGRVGEAIPLLERALTDRERLLGPDHPDTLASRSNLASAYAAAGRLGEAISLYEQVLADAQRTLGPEHPYTRSLHQLAVSFRRQAAHGRQA